MTGQVYQLRYPLTIKLRSGADEREERIESVTLRRPTARDMRLIDDFAGRPMAMTLAMIQALSGLEPHVVDRLDAEDMTALGELVGDFIPDGQETGETD
ncbi:MAG: phage tail assembly protein [Blastomonas sp.]